MKVDCICTCDECQNLVFVRTLVNQITAFVLTVIGSSAIVVLSVSSVIDSIAFVSKITNTLLPYHVHFKQLDRLHLEEAIKVGKKEK